MLSFLGWLIPEESRWPYRRCRRNLDFVPPTRFRRYHRYSRKVDSNRLFTFRLLTGGRPPNQTVCLARLLIPTVKLRVCTQPTVIGFVEKEKIASRPFRLECVYRMCTVH